jgi:hypothetical protein
MPYALGIDIGAAVVAAALCPLDEGTATRPRVLRLGAHLPTAACALFLDTDGYLIAGDDARQAGESAPHQLLTGFHQRVGDDVPIMAGGQAFTAESLSAMIVTWVLGHVDTSIVDSGQVTTVERLVVTHPENWGPYRRGLLASALEAEGAPEATLVSSAEAVAEGGLREMPDPDANTAPIAAARGAVLLATRATRPAPAADTVVLSKVSGQVARDGSIAPNRPTRPSVRITPFTPPVKSVASPWRRRQTQVAAAVVMALAVIGTQLGFQGRLASATVAPPGVVATQSCSPPPAEPTVTARDGERC